MHSTEVSKKPAEARHKSLVYSLCRGERTFKHDLLVQIRSAQVGKNGSATAEGPPPEECLDLACTAFARDKLLELMRDRLYVHPNTFLIGSATIT